VKIKIIFNFEYITCERAEFIIQCNLILVHYTRETLPHGTG